MTSMRVVRIKDDKNSQVDRLFFECEDCGWSGTELSSDKAVELANKHLEIRHNGEGEVKL